MSDLRPYQIEALNAIQASFRSKRRVVLSLPTGAGKTLVASTFCKKNYLDGGKSVLWIAHNAELLNQAHLSFSKLGCDEKNIGRRYAEFNDLDTKDDARLWLISNTIHWLPTVDFDLIVIDEAHHADGNSYKGLLLSYEAYKPSGPLVLGLTATPYRRHAGEIVRLTSSVFSFSNPKINIFEEIAYERSFCELAAQGFVAPFRHVRYETNIKFSLAWDGNLHDFKQDSLDQLDTPKRNKIIYDIWKQKEDVYGKTLIFVGTQKHSRRLAKYFAEDGVYVVSEMDREQRRDAIADFRNNRIKVLINVGIFKEGVDVPDIRTIILARPTASPMLFTQMIGRGSRILPNKRFFYLLDIHDQLGKYEGYLMGVKDLDDNDGKHVRTIEQRSEAAERVSHNKLCSLMQDPRVIVELLSTSVQEILCIYAGWIIFEQEDGAKSPIGVLLTSDDLSSILGCCGVCPRLEPSDVEKLEQFKARGTAITRCISALKEGLIGLVERFSLIAEVAKEIENLKVDAQMLYGIGNQSVGLKIFSDSLSDRAAKWGVRETLVGETLDKYLNSRDFFGAVIRTNVGGPSSLRLVTRPALECLRGAIKQKLAGAFASSDIIRIAKVLKECDPGLESHLFEILVALETATGIDDVCVVCP